MIWICCGYRKLGIETQAENFFGQANNNDDSPQSQPEPIQWVTNYAIQPLIGQFQQFQEIVQPLEWESRKYGFIQYSAEYFVI